ncbi:MAG: hypothetical protein RLY66_254 [Candidatus Parcubacteria bacterium]|jgi:hypothetical protein
MIKYFLAPRSGEKSYKNFLSTIKHGIPLDAISKSLNVDGKDILNKQEVIYAWGNREGKKHEWEKMNTGDIVIFYALGDFVMSGEVIYKQHSDQLALSMWPPDENGQPWSYTFFLNNLKYFKIPLSVFNVVSGYRFKALMGFQEIRSEAMENIQRRYMSVDRFLQAFSDENSKEIPQKDDAIFINIQPSIQPVLSNKKIELYKSDDTLTKKRKNGFVDFDELNKTRARIGSLGEEIVLKFEKDSLIMKGRSDLAEKVQRVSLQNTYAGYDIESYHEDGKVKKIEVKSTSVEQSKVFSFNISRNEKKVAENEENYFIYLVYAVKSEYPKIHIIENPFQEKNNLSIEPISYIVKGKFTDPS